MRTLFAWVAILVGMPLLIGCAFLGFGLALGAPRVLLLLDKITFLMSQLTWN